MLELIKQMKLLHEYADVVYILPYGIISGNNSQENPFLSSRGNGLKEGPTCHLSVARQTLITHSFLSEWWGGFSPDPHGTRQDPAEAPLGGNGGGAWGKGAGGGAGAAPA